MANGETLDPVWTCKDDYGDEIEIAVITGDEDGYGDEGEAAAVHVAGFTLGKAGREEFQRLFMEAERRAEAVNAAAKP